MLAEQEKIHPRLREALETHGKLGLYSYAPSPTREMLELTHTSAVLRVLTQGDPLLLRAEQALTTYFSTPATMDETAQVLGFGRETIRKDVWTSLTTRHLHLSPVYQKLYPLEQMLYTHSKYLPPEHRLLIANNIGSRIIEAIEQDSDFAQILSLLDMKMHSLAVRLRLLRELDIKVPHIPYSPEENQWIIAGLQDQTKTDEEVQFYLDQVTNSVYYLNKKEEPFLIAITNVARDAGYHVYGRNAGEFIETVELKVPVSPEFNKGMQNGRPKRYRFTVAWHEDRIIEAIRTNEELKKYLIPIVEQISGKALPNDELPTTWQIIKRKGFVLVANVLSEIGIKSGTNRSRKVREAMSQNSFEGPSFLYQNIFVIPESSRYKLQEYAKRVLKNEPGIPAK